MSHKEIVRKKKSKIIEVYEDVEIDVGECPACHCRQISEHRHIAVDVLCDYCGKLQLSIERVDMNDKFRGAIIEEIIWDGDRCPIDDIDKIRIRTADDVLYDVMLDCRSEYNTLNVVNCE